jgi:hypothetical protein
MAWKRLGVVFSSDGKQPWARSHAALPTPVHVAGDVFRFFYSSRDAERRSHVGWADVEVSEAPRVLEIAGEPVLSPGEDGTFDDSGVGIGCITADEGSLWLYYMGWNSNASHRGRFSTGHLKILTPSHIPACFGSARRTGGCGMARISWRRSATPI